MNAFTYTSGSSPVQVNFPTYSAIALTGNITLQWATVDQDTSTAVALWMTVTPTGAYSITMPDATAIGPGNATIFFNIGPSTITILGNQGASITTIASGVAKYLLLNDNATQNGSWTVITFGAGTSSADAAALAGLGLQANGAMLQQNDIVNVLVADYTIATTDRAQVFQVSGSTGAGTLSLTAAATLGSGFWFGFSNLGTGAWSIDPNGSETIDGSTTLSINPMESLLVFCTGSAFVSVGRGRSVLFTQTALVKSVAGNTDVTLTSTEASNSQIEFTGALTGDINVIVPAVVNSWEINNATTGSYTLTVKTSAGSGTVAPQGEQVILKCDGTNVLSAFTSVPTGAISMADGSTSSPGLPFTLEPSTGFSRPSAGHLAVSILGTEIFDVASTGIEMNGTGITGLASLTVTSTDAGASAGPTLTLWRDSGSPAASDVIGYIAMDGQNSTPAEVTYAAAQATILDPTASSEDATFDFLTRVAGTLAKRGFWGQGLVVGAGLDGGAGTITATGSIAATGLVITTTGTGSTGQLVSTDSGSSPAPILELYRNSSSPAVNDDVGAVYFTGQNSTPASVSYADIIASIVDPTASSEDGVIHLRTRIAGAIGRRVDIGAGLYTANATGGDKGIDTINAAAYYINGTLLSITGPYAAKTTGYTIASTDNAGIIDFTTAGETCAFTAAATLGSGFRVTIVNSAASGVVTLDPNGSETIDGLTTRLLSPGDRVTIVCTGSAFKTTAGMYTFTASAVSFATTGSVSTAHSLGVNPNYARTWMICTDAGGDLGYSQNDQVGLNLGGAGANNIGPIVGWNSTNLNIAWSNNPPFIAPKTGGGVSAITGSKWALYVTLGSIP